MARAVTPREISRMSEQEQLKLALQLSLVATPASAATASQTLQSHPRDENFECAICLDLLCEPVRLPCSHVFCRRCLVAAVSERRKCPMCRAELAVAFDVANAPVDQALREQIVSDHAAEYANKCHGLICDGDAGSFAAAPRVRIGNRCEHIPSLAGTLDRTGRRTKQKRWTLFVEFEDTLLSRIANVRFKLAPHGFTRDVVLEMAPFRVSRLAEGRGEFPVEIVVTFDAETQRNPMVFVHKLCLDGEGTSKTVPLDLASVPHLTSGGSVVGRASERQSVRRSSSVSGSQRRSCSSSAVTANASARFVAAVFRERSNAPAQRSDGFAPPSRSSAQQEFETQVSPSSRRSSSRGAVGRRSTRA